MPGHKDHVVTLTSTGRRKLIRLVSTGTHPARTVMRARVLLELDENARVVPERQVVAERVGVSEQTVYLIAKRFTETSGDIDEVIRRRKRVEPPVPAKVTGDVEARVIALACTTPRRGMTGGRCGCWRNTWCCMGFRRWITPRSVGP